MKGVGEAVQGDGHNKDRAAVHLINKKNSKRRKRLSMMAKKCFLQFPHKL
jgi:hypothetical protein